MAITYEQFTQRLVASGLLSAEELREAADKLAPAERGKDPQALARLLITAGKLTKHQATAIYKGETKHLVMGNYVILDKLGEGGMGEVYRARHKVMEREVALKVLPAAMVNSPDAAKRFQREVRAAAKLEHQNIVVAYDADQAAGRHFLVMQFVDGRDLSGIVKQNGPMTIEQAIDCCTQAARGLSYAHSRGVIHRDIKPSNLLLDKSGTIKILDMGLARLAEGGDDNSGLGALTQSGQIMGTVDYMAPEQAEDTHEADQRADIYSLGCTLYVLLTAKAPFQGATVLQKMMAHQQKPVPKLSDARGDASPKLDAVLAKLLAKSPDQRYQTMDEVIVALASCLAREEAHAAGALAAGSSDSHLTAFLDKLAHQDKPAGATRASTALGKHEETINKQPAAQADDTGTGITRPPRAVTKIAARVGEKPQAAPVRLQRRRPKTLALALLAGGGVLSLGLLAGVLALLLAQPWNTNETNGPPNETPPVAVTAPAIDDGLAPCEILTSSDYEWTQPVNLGPAVNSPNFELSPTLAADGLTLLFASDRAAGSQGKNDLWLCRRTSPTADWSPPVNLGPTVNSPAHDRSPALSADGLTMLFASDRERNEGKFRLWAAMRKTVDSSWSTPAPVLDVASNEVDDEPEISADGLTLMFSSVGRPNGFAKENLWQCLRAKPTDAWGEPQVLGAAVNGMSREFGPTLSADGRVLIFSSDRGGGESAIRCWMSTRTSPDGAWSPATPLGLPAAIGGDEISPALSADGRTLVFRSHRAGGQGEADLWLSRRVRKASSPVNLPGAPQLVLRKKLAGHTQIVHSLSFHPRSQQLASGAEAGQLYLWDTAGEQKLGELVGYAQRVHVNALAFAPDGQRLVSSDGFWSLKVWDVAKRTLISSTDGRFEPVAFSPDGQFFATGGQGPSRAIRDPVTLAVKAPLEAYAEIDKLAFSHDGKLLATGAGGRLDLHQLPEGKRLSTDQWHQPLTFAFSGDNRTLAVAGPKVAGVSLFDLTKPGSPLPMNRGVQLETGESVRALIWMPGSRYLVCAVKSQPELQLWDTQTSKLVAKLRGHTKPINAIALSPDGRTLATAGEDFDVFLWNIQPAAAPPDDVAARLSARLRITLPESNADWVAVSDDGQHIAARSRSEKLIKQWNLTTGHRLKIDTAAERRFALAYQPGGKLLAAGEENTLATFDTAGRPMPAKVAHRAWVSAIAFGKDDRLATCGGNGDARVLLWKLPALDEPQELGKHGDGNSAFATSLAFSPDGKLVASGGNDSKVRIYDVATAKEIKVLDGGYLVQAVAFSPDGRYLASGDRYQTTPQNTVGIGRVKLWNTTTWTVEREMADYTYLVNCVAFSPDSRLLAVAIEVGQGPVCVYDLALGGPPLVIDECRAGSVAFLPTGHTLVTASEKTGTQLWDIDVPSTSGAVPRNPVRVAEHAGTSWFTRLAISPDDKTVYAMNRDGHLHIYDLATRAKVRDFRAAWRIDKKTPANGGDVAISFDGRWLAATANTDGDAEGLITVWDLPKMASPKYLPHTGAQVTQVFFSPGDREILGFYTDGKVRRWNLADGKLLGEIDGFPTSAAASSSATATVAREPSSNTWAAIDWQNDTLTLGGAPLPQSAKSGSEWRNAIAFSPDGRWLAASERTGEVHLWDVATRQKKRSWPAPKRVTSIAFAPDVKTVAIGIADPDCAVKFYSTTSGEELASIVVNDATFTADDLQFTSDGKYLVLAARTLQYWDVAALTRAAAQADYTNGLGMKFVRVPAGKSWLGGGGGKAGTKEVVFSDDFYLGKFEVTQGEWLRVMQTNPSAFSRGGVGKGGVQQLSDAELLQLPVDQVSWDDCQQFLARLNEQAHDAGWTYRLPTVAEWEYACRGGPLATPAESAFDFYVDRPTNDLLPSQANFALTGLKRTQKVGAFPPNRLGLHDMHGNLWEWCQDSQLDATGKLQRRSSGGSWLTQAQDCRAARRGGDAPTWRHYQFGFRVCRVRTTDITNALGMQFVRVPAGKSWLGGGGGRPGDKPVEFADDFYLGKFEVTQGEWEEAMDGSRPSYFLTGAGGGDAVKGLSDAERKSLPVENVSWDHVQEFLRRLNAKAGDSGWAYRLPTSDEWEYAARGGPLSDPALSGFDFYFSQPTNTLLASQANFLTTDLKRPLPVGDFPPNSLGLHDLFGNVREWCQDEMKHPGDGTWRRVVRGGGWNIAADICRANRVDAAKPGDKLNNLGFRVARVPAGDWIDVIPLINPARDKIDIPNVTGKNDWQIRNGELVCTSEKERSKLLLPVLFQGRRLEWEVEFTRTSPGGVVNFDLPAKKGVFSVCLNDKGVEGIFLGLGRFPGAFPFPKAGQRVSLKLVMELLSDTEQRIECFVDGNSLGQWRGDREVDGKTLATPYVAREALSLFVTVGNFDIHRIRVRSPHGGIAARFPETSPLPPPGIGAWQSLFNGSDLTGWQPTDPKHTGKAEAIVEDDWPVLRLSDRYGLLSTKAIKDFHLRYDFKMQQGCRGGMNVFTAPAAAGVQLRMDSLARSTPALEYHSYGVTYQEADFQQGKFVPRGAKIAKEGYINFTQLDLNTESPWQRIEVIRLGDSILFLMNAQVVGAVTSLRDARDDAGKPLGYSGVSFWSDGLGKANFRNIELREINALPPEVLEITAWQPLFNGSDLTGWEVKLGPPECWKVENGVIGVSPRTKDDRGWLGTTRSYGDYSLRFEVRMPEATNSGVFLRAYGEVKWGSPKGPQIELPGGGIAGHIQPANLRAWWPTAWNKFEVTVTGDHVVVVLNGETIVDGQLPNYGVKEGPIGIEMYNGAAEFRNIVVITKP